MLKPIARGITLLDEHAPEEWWNEINLEEFDVHDGFDCVLGQVFGSYREGKATLGINHRVAASHGFLAISAKTREALNRGWAEAIRELRRTRVDFYDDKPYRDPYSEVP